MTKPAIPTFEPQAPVLETHAVFGLFSLCWRLDEILAQQELTQGLGRLECYLVMLLTQPCRMGELAKRVFMVPSTVTSAAQRLESEGLAQRVRDRSDRRVFLLELTAKGHSLRQVLEARAAQAFRDLSGLTAEETRNFAFLTSKIQDKFQSPAQQRAQKET